MKRKYRIVKDKYLGFEVQTKHRLSPFWIQCSDGDRRVNTWPSQRMAEDFIKEMEGKGKNIPEFLPPTIARLPEIKLPSFPDYCINSMYKDIQEILKPPIPSKDRHIKTNINIWPFC